MGFFERNMYKSGLAGDKPTIVDEMLFDEEAYKAKEEGYKAHLANKDLAERIAAQSQSSDESSSDSADWDSENPASVGEKKDDSSNHFLLYIAVIFPSIFLGFITVGTWHLVLQRQFDALGSLDAIIYASLAWFVMGAVVMVCIFFIAERNKIEQRRESITGHEKTIKELKERFPILDTPKYRDATEIDYKDE